MKLMIVFLLFGIFGGSPLLASRDYDPFEGGRFICHREDHLKDHQKDFYFQGDFTVPYEDKQTKFKPLKIQLTTTTFHEDGFIFKSRKFQGIEDLTFFQDYGDQIVLCGEKLSKSEASDCSYKGGDDITASPEMAYFINCGQKRLHLEISQNNELFVNCTDASGKSVSTQKFMGCIRSK